MLMISIAQEKICLAYVHPKNVLLRCIYGMGPLLRSCLTCLLSEILTEGQTTPLQCCISEFNVLGKFV